MFNRKFIKIREREREIHEKEREGKRKKNKKNKITNVMMKLGKTVFYEN